MTNKIKTIIQKMENDEKARKYFFKNAPNYQNLSLWLEPLYKAGYFNPKNNPKPIENPKDSGYFKIPYWEVLDFLEAVAIQNKDNPKEEVEKLLIEIIENIMNYKDENGEKINNYFTDWYMIKILFHLPTKYIKSEHIKFIEKSLKESKFEGLLNSEIVNIVLSVLINNNMKNHVLEIIKIIFDYKLHSDDRISLIGNYWLFELLKKYSKEIAVIIGRDGLEIIFNIMEKIIKEDKGSFNNVWIVTIEEHPQNRFPDKYDNLIVSFARDILEELDIEKHKDIINELLKKEHPIFKRLAMHSINYHYNVLKDVFWNWFKNYNPEINSLIKHELYKLFEDRSIDFTNEEFELVINRIKILDYKKYYKNISKENIEKINAYKRKEWLIPLKERNKKAKELYEKYNKINPEKIEYPGFSYWMSDIKVGYESPIEDINDFCKKDINEIVYYIKYFNPLKYKSSKIWGKEELIEGLADNLSYCIERNPSKFVDNIELFYELDYIHKYYLIYGVLKAFEKNYKIDWNKVFNFIYNELNNGLLISDNKYAKLLKSEIVTLIEKGTKNDNKAFDKSLLPQIKKVLFYLIENRDNEKIDGNDWNFFVLNSFNGKVLHALINYALRYGRLHSNQKIKWEDDIKDFFTQQLEGNNEYSKYIFTILGEYLNNIIFLDKEWIFSNFNKIFPKNNKNLWEVSIGSYFLYTNRVYKEIYEKMQNDSHLQQALNYNFKNEMIRERFVQYICVGYFAEFDDKTIFNIIERKDLKDIKEIISFVWLTYKDSFKKEQKEKIIKLWEKIYFIYKEMNDENKEEIFSELSKWFVFIEQINNKHLEMLKISAKYVERNYNSYFIVEQLIRLVEKYPKEVSEIFLEMLDNDIFPTYKEENIRFLIEKIKEYDSSIAIKIVNLYISKGIYLFKDLIKKDN